MPVQLIFNDTGKIEMYKTTTNTNVTRIKLFVYKLRCTQTPNHGADTHWLMNAHHMISHMHNKTIMGDNIRSVSGFLLLKWLLVFD